MNTSVPLTLQSYGQWAGSGSYSPGGQIVAWCPFAGSTLLAVAGKGPVLVWDAMSQQLHAMYSEHTGKVRSLAWSPDGTSIAIGGDHSSVRVWEPASGRQLWVLASLSRFGKRQPGIGGPHGVHDGVLMPPVSDHAVSALAWSPDGGRIAVSVVGEKKIHVLQASTDFEEVTCESAEGVEVNALAWMPDGERLISAGRNHALQVWDAATGQQVMQQECPGTWRGVMALAPDSERIVLGTDNGTVQMMQWRDQRASEDLETLFALRLSSTAYPVSCLAWSPDGRAVASASSKEVLLWNARTAEVLDRASVDDTVLSVAFSSDGRLLAAGSIGGYAQLWRVDGNDAAPAGEEVWGAVLDLRQGDLVVRNRRPYFADGSEFNDNMGVCYRVEEVHESSVELIGLDGSRHHLVPLDLMVSNHWQRADG